MRQRATVLAFFLFVAIGAVPSAHADSLWVSSAYTNQVLRYNASGAFISAAGDGGLNFPEGVVVGRDNNVYVSSLGSNQVLRYDGVGAFIDAFVPENSGGLIAPQGLIFGPDGNLYVSSSGTYQVLRYNGKTGAFIDAFVPANSGGLSGPSFLARAPFLSGCVQQEGVPVVGAKVTVTNQTATAIGKTGVNGCYAFKSGGLLNKTNTITIYLPPAP